MPQPAVDLPLNFAHLYTLVIDNHEILAALMLDGWRDVSLNVIHVHLRHPTKPGRTTVPHPVKDMPIGTLRSIERQSGVKLKG